MKVANRATVVLLVFGMLAAWVLLAPAAVLVVLVSWFYAGFAASSVRFDPPVLLEPGQWVVLAVTPLATLLVGMALVHRRERRLHLIRLGEAAERDQVTAEVSSP